ncbi:hypothetical protein F0344_05850 [Streptomyces finlayi]|uniref:Uncharacterized protein n=1 Tax=Streptomyces finlayi TaxID=67296 RepID=A0A7G7BFS7_9ACTN|nr:hypothetical protein [Streptomyces finlayi]QNE74192.1 hypothetical protein F0344_05850 [Streptomyces finlayi]
MSNGTYIASEERVFGQLTLKIVNFSAQGWSWDSFPPGYFYLGGGLVPPSGQKEGWAVLAKNTNPSDPVIASPQQWKMVTKNGIWRPVPPPGYRALSDLDDNGGIPGNPLPEWKIAQVFGCVKEKGSDGHPYLHRGNPVEHAYGENRAWYIRAPYGWFDTAGFKITPTEYGGECLYSPGDPLDSPVNWVLNLPVKPEIGPDPQTPAMTDYGVPQEDTPWSVERRVKVPCLAVKDTGRSLIWQLQNSPTYTLERRSCYHREGFINNKDGSIPQSRSSSWMTGVSEGVTKEWSAKVGVSVGFETGVKAGVLFAEATAKFSANLSIEAGYSSATRVEEMKSHTDTVELVAPPHHSAAMYGIQDELRMIREDGTVVGGQEGGLTFEQHDSSYYVYFPSSDGDGRDAGLLASLASASSR